MKKQWSRSLRRHSLYRNTTNRNTTNRETLQIEPSPTFYLFSQKGVLYNATSEMKVQKHVFDVHVYNPTCTYKQKQVCMKINKTYY